MILLLVLSLSIDSVLNQADLAHAHVGMIVVNLDKDSVVYARNYQKNLVPASNTKLITSAAALTFLAPDFRFKTRLALDGNFRGDKLRGDIIIIGGGDPSFSLEDVEQFVSTIKSTHVSSIEGDIVLVDNYFTNERLPIGWAWHYLDARYAAEISALSMNRNVVNVRIEATRLGKRAKVNIEPATQYVRLVNSMVTKSGKDSIIIYRRPEENIIYVDGGIGFGRTRNIEVAVKDPSLFFGQYLKERLRESNIKVSGKCIRNGGYDAYAIDSTYNIVDSVMSAPLYEIIKELNTESINLYAEALLKMMGAYFLKEGSFRAGVSIMKELLKRCGVDTSHVVLYDGSGLSRHNLISPYDVMLVLRYMYHGELFEDFYNLLPGPGEGTLETRFTGLDGFMRAKTGTLHAVSCLSGYLRLRDTDYCFSLMLNNFATSGKKIEQIQEEIMEELKKFLEKEA